MSKELKRVPLKFDWPTGKTWEGYLNPHFKPCPNPECEAGVTPARRWLENIAHLILMLGDDVVENKVKGRPLHPWLASVANLGASLNVNIRPGPEARDLADGLAGRASDPLFGYDSVSRYRALKKIILAAGLNPKTWGICPACKGHGVDPVVRPKWSRWRRKEPPKGVGFQLWENCTEGSPVSPVFKTLDELCEWCEENATTFADERASAAMWKQMLTEGTVHSAVQMPDGSTAIFT